MGIIDEAIYRLTSPQCGAAETGLAMLQAWREIVLDAMTSGDDRDAFPTSSYF